MSGCVLFKGKCVVLWYLCYMGVCVLYGDMCVILLLLLLLVKYEK